MITGAVGTNEHNSWREVIVKVSSTVECLKVFIDNDSRPITFYFEGEGMLRMVEHPWIYKEFSPEDCKEFGVDFGGWLSS